MIRFLHTSDWHLGLELGGHDRLPEQERFLDWLLETCRTRSIDALLVCGDVYDTVNPSVPAQRAFADFLVRFHATMPDAHLVIIGGNHDSAGRIELPRPFGEALGRIHLRGMATRNAENFRIPLRDAQGKVQAHVLAVPFLRPSDLDCRIEGDETPQEAFLRRVSSYYAEVRAAIPAEDSAAPVIAMGHLTLAGSARAGSERVLIGGVESVPVAALSQACDYAALGHIHRAQTVTTDSVRYCGSPYPVDFDERRYPHGVLLVEIEAADTVPAIEFLETPSPAPFLRFSQDPMPWDEVERLVESFDWSPWKDCPRSLQPLVELRYDARQPVDDLRRRCEALCRDKPLRLVSAPRGIGEADTAAQESGPQDLKDRETPAALFERHWTGRFGTPPPEPVRACLDEVLAEVAIGIPTP